MMKREKNYKVPYKTSIMNILHGILLIEEAIGNLSTDSQLNITHLTDKFKSLQTQFQMSFEDIIGESIIKQLRIEIINKEFKT